MTSYNETESKGARRFPRRSASRAGWCKGLQIFLIVAVQVYWPAFGGAFLSTTLALGLTQPLHPGLWRENLLLIARPLGEASFAVGNYRYAPPDPRCRVPIFRRGGGGLPRRQRPPTRSGCRRWSRCCRRSQAPRAAALFGARLPPPPGERGGRWLDLPALVTVLSMVPGLSAVLLPFAGRPALATLSSRRWHSSPSRAPSSRLFLIVCGWAGTGATSPDLVASGWRSSRSMQSLSSTSSR
jgi:hypothetical protein